MKRRQVLGLSAGLLALTMSGCNRAPDEDDASADSAALLYAQQLPDLSGQMHALEHWRGQPMVINFWATWCAPCVREMPDLDELQAEFPSVRFVGVGIDSTQNMLEFVKKVPVSYTLLEARASGLDLMQQLGNSTGGLPFTLVVSAHETVARSIEGQIDPDDLRATLRQLATGPGASLNGRNTVQPSHVASAAAKAPANHGGNPGPGNSGLFTT